MNVSLMKSAKTLALDTGSGHFCRDADGLAGLSSSQTSTPFTRAWKKDMTDLPTVPENAKCRCFVLPLFL